MATHRLSALASSSCAFKWSSQRLAWASNWHNHQTDIVQLIPRLLCSDNMKS